MESRMRRYGLQVSPERTKVWTEPPSKHHQQRKKVPLVYYLCKNRHLENPHFIEVPLASPEGLYLKDVINRLNALRGKGMGAMYSWSCKRSYKNGFVWHDLAEDDLILPVQGNEYVLKGSELLDQSSPDRHHNGLSNQKMQNTKHLHKEASCSSKPDEPSSSSAVMIKEAKHISPPQTPPLSSPATEEDELSPTIRQSSSSGNLSPEAGVRTSPLSATGSRSPVKYMVSKPVGSQDASTQTDDRGSKNPSGMDTCITGVSTDDGNPDSEFNEWSLCEGIQCSKVISQVVTDGRSPPPTSSRASSSCGNTSTLESLIREEVTKRNSFRILDEEIFVPHKTKIKATNALIQLLTCGSITVKDHYSFGLVPTYKPRFTNTKLPSPVTTNSLVLAETDCLSESQRAMGLRLMKEYQNGSIMEPNSYKDKAGEVLPDIQGSSSFDVDRNCGLPDSRSEKEIVDSVQSNFLSRSVKIASSESFRNDKSSNMSPMSDSSCKSSPLSSSKVGSGKFFDSSSFNEYCLLLHFSDYSLYRLIENGPLCSCRLTSGARVVIQAISLPTDNVDSFD